MGCTDGIGKGQKETEKNNQFNHELANIVPCIGDTFMAQLYLFLVYTVGS